MGDVTRQQGLFAIRSDMDAHVSRAVARAGDQGDFVTKHGVAGHQVCLAGIDDRPHRIHEHRRLGGLITVVAPMLVFVFPEYIPRVAESGHPSAVNEAGVPAHVIDMQVRAQHDVDAVRRKAGVAHGLEKRPFPVVPGRHGAAFLVISEPGIDHDAQRRRLDYERVDRHLESTFLGGEMGDQPRQISNLFVGGQRQDKARASDRFQFDDFRDLDLAHLPMHRRFPKGLAFSASFVGERCWFPPLGAMDHLTGPRVEGQLEARSLRMPELAVSAEKVAFLIEKMREFDVKEADSDPDSGSNSTDDRMIDVLEDNGQDPVVREITGFIAGMTEDEQIDLIALIRLGRGDATIEEWDELRRETAAGRDTSTARYLLGEPLASDYLADGLDQFGLTWTDERTTPVP